LLDINYTLLIQMVNFLLLVLILNWLLVKPVMKIIDERRNRVEGNEDEAERLMNEADENISEYEGKLAEARMTASREKEKIRMEGIQLETEILKTARDETRKMIENMKVRIEEESRQASLDMKKEIDSLSLEMAERILGRKI
jgi:F-type H+-transporting ATPase subunit b